jgi:hypothetical protein
LKQWARIHILYEAQTSPGQQSLPNDRSTELETLEELAQKQRDIGRLEEPLATSVLEYSLRLKPTLDNKVKEDTINDIERKIFNDPLARIADRENARPRPQQASSTLSGLPQDMITTRTSNFMPSPSSMNTNPAIQSQDSSQMFAGEQVLTSTLPTFFQEGGDDWWQSDLDTLTQAMRSHNDLFEIGH